MKLRDNIEIKKGDYLKRSMFTKQQWEFLGEQLPKQGFKAPYSLKFRDMFQDESGAYKIIAPVICNNISSNVLGFCSKPLDCDINPLQPSHFFEDEVIKESTSIREIEKLVKSKSAWSLAKEVLRLREDVKVLQDAVVKGNLPSGYTQEHLTWLLPDPRDTFDNTLVISTPEGKTYTFHKHSQYGTERGEITLKWVTGENEDS